MINYLLYIDPGSGSYILQAIVAGVLGAAFWIKMSWHRIKHFFSSNKMKTDDNKEEENPV